MSQFQCNAFLEYGLMVIRNLSGLLVLPLLVNVILTGVSFVIVAVVGFALGPIAVTVGFVVVVEL
jgi:hypothetical protein